MEWCTGEKELYNMTADPHQIDNLLYGYDPDNAAIDKKFVERLRELGWLLNHLADCVGPECYELDRLYDKKKRMKRKYEKKPPVPLDCVFPHGWPDFSLVDPNQGRKLFAYNLSVPEPFQHGWPFSDEAVVSDELLEVWDAYSHYFH
jgi:hypothetical protein